MYRHELYKIFTRKSIYVVLFFVILTMGYSSGYPDSYLMKEDIYEDLYETWGGPVTEEKVNLASEKSREADERAAKGVTSTFEERAAGNVHNLVAMAGQQSESLTEIREDLQHKMDNVDQQSFEYKEAEKEWSMLEQLGEPYGFYLIQAWRGMIYLIEPFFGIIFLSMLILIGLIPVISDEYTKRTVGLILATKNGKKRIVTAKILAALTYLVVVFALVHVVNLFLQWYKFGGLKGWDAPIQNLLGDMIANPIMGNSPFDWDVWQFYAITLSVQFLACVAFAILVLCISMIVKNAMIAFFMSGAILGVPFIFRQLGLEKGIFEYINSFSYLEFIRVERLFHEFNAYNLLGFPVLYPHMLLFAFGCITVAILLYTYYRFARQQVNM